MKKIIILVGVLILATATLNAQGLNLEQILANHYKAMGLDKQQDVKSIIMTGTLIRNDAMPIKIFRLRPNCYRMERDVADITGLTVFDGKNGWMTAPWSGNSQPQVISGTGLAELQVQADFDGPIYRWNDKGHKAELIGTEKLGEIDVFRIKLTRNDGGIEYYLIDCHSYLLHKKISYRTIRGKETEMENIYSDYRSIDGIMFAFTNVNTLGGQPYSEIQFDSVEINQPVDEKLFVMPIIK